MELKGKKILFLGDSITEGSGVSDINDVYWKQLEKNTGAECVGYGIGGPSPMNLMNGEIFATDALKWTIKPI